MDQAIDYLQRIHGTIIKSAGSKISREARELCRHNIAELGLLDTNWIFLMALCVML